jgi:hypothetical protein
MLLVCVTRGEGEACTGTVPRLSADFVSRRRRGVSPGRDPARWRGIRRPDVIDDLLFLSGTAATFVC